MAVYKQLEQLNREVGEKEKDLKEMESKIEDCTDEQRLAKHESVRERLINDIKDLNARRKALEEKLPGVVSDTKNTWGAAGLTEGTAPAGGDMAAARHAQRINFQNVVRLVDADNTVGSACLVDCNGRLLLLAARHCLNPQAGQPINVASYTVCGHGLRHLGSFPAYDISVLQPDDSQPLPQALQDAHPFMVNGGIGLGPSMEITLVGFPLAADLTVEGFQQSCLPMEAKGHVSWITETADEAIGTYSGALPNCSGGAVSIGPPFRFLVGMHLGTIWHEEGRNPRDIAAHDDQGASVSSGGAQAAAGSELVMETDTWSTATATGLARQAVCGRGADGRKRKHAQQGAAAHASEVQYCLDNVGHKGCMATFIPAATLVRLLGRCLPRLA